MANPQLEKGYVRISTELLKAIYYHITNPTHLRLVLFVVRFTYGYRRKEFDTHTKSIGTTLRLSTEYCQDMIHDISDKCRVLNANWKSNSLVTLSINKDYDKWRIDK